LEQAHFTVILSFLLQLLGSQSSDGARGKGRAAFSFGASTTGIGGTAVGISGQGRTSTVGTDPRGRVGIGRVVWVVWVVWVVLGHGLVDGVQIILC